MTIYIDIETIPNLSAEQIAEIEASITAPGNYKKPESIAEWMVENKQRMVDEAVGKASLDGATGRIICISWAFDDKDVVNTSGDEKDALQDLFGSIETGSHGMLHNVCGHNVSWDLRYIWQRAVVNQIKPPSMVKWQGKPWDHQDTMLLWNPDSQKRISLDRLCKVLGVPTSKADLDGSKIWQAYKDGRMDEIAAYCSADVEATRECYRRMMFA